MADSLESANAYQKAHLGDSKRAEIIAPTVIFLVIAYLAVFFRYKSRRIAGVRLGPEYVPTFGVLSAYYTQNINIEELYLGMSICKRCFNTLYSSSQKSTVLMARVYSSDWCVGIGLVRSFHQTHLGKC